MIEPGDAPANSVVIDPAPDATAPPPAAPLPPPDDGDDSTASDDVPPDVTPASPPVDVADTPPAAPEQPLDDDPRSLDEFGPRLSPYGTWSDDASYGTVWTPDQSIVGSGFSPYLSGGHWILDAGGSRNWVSSYPFGDIVFHYGRWVWATRGWSWIPGYRYAPAWVAWRVPTDAYAYYGWAPLPPDFVWVNHAAASLSWRSSYYWIFCPSTFVYAASPGLYVVHSTADARSIARHTRTVLPAVTRISRNTYAMTATRVARPMARVVAPRNLMMRRAPATHVAPPAPRTAPMHGGGPQSRSYGGRGGGRGR